MLRKIEKDTAEHAARVAVALDNESGRKTMLGGLGRSVLALLDEVESLSTDLAASGARNECASPAAVSVDDAPTDPLLFRSFLLKSLEQIGDRVDQLEDPRGHLRLPADELLRTGFEIAVDNAEMCHEASCTHDAAESHLNWTEARSALDGYCASMGRSQDKQARELCALLAEWDWDALAGDARRGIVSPDCADIFDALARISAGILTAAMRHGSF